MAAGAIMVVTPPTSFCIPSSIGMLLGVAIAAFFFYLMWDYLKRYYEVIRKIRPDLSGLSLLLTPMFRPFLIYGKEARALPEYKRMWRPILIQLASFIPIAFIFFTVFDYRCPS